MWMIVGGLMLLMGATLLAVFLVGGRQSAAPAGDWIAWGGVVSFAAAALAGGWLGAGALRDGLITAALVLLGAGLWLRQRRRRTRG